MAGIFDAELVRTWREAALRRSRCAGNRAPGTPGLQEHSAGHQCLSVCRPAHMQGSEVPALHVIGNHCLSVPRAHLLKRLRIPETCYYSRRWVGRVDVW